MQTKPKINWSDIEYSSPPWMGTPQVADKVLLPGGATLNPSAFDGSFTLTIAAEAVADGATVLSVTCPETKLVPKGTVLAFAVGETVATDVIVTADHTVGPIVSNLPVTGIGSEAKPAAGMTVTLPAIAGRHLVESGILVGRTYAERAAGLGYRPVTVDNLSAMEQIYLLAFPLPDVWDSNFAELYMHGNVVYEDKLPGFTDLAATVQAKIRDLYVCILFGGE
ncbi:MAG: hypothetical protein ACHWZW_02885 [Spirulina sp.]